MKFLNSFFLAAAMMIAIIGCTTITAAPPVQSLPTKLFSTATSLKHQANCFAGRGAIYHGTQAAVPEEHAQEHKISAHFPPGQSFEYKGESFVCYRFIYQVDDVWVEGYMVKPLSHGTQRMPAIIYNRGGNDSLGVMDIRDVYAIHIELASQGFVVISSQYRGADVWPKDTTVNIGKDEFGGRDVADVNALIPILDQMPEVDPQRIGMFGISRGGMMTYLAARLNPRIKAIVVWAGVTDKFTQVMARPEMEKFVFRRLIPNYELNKEQVLKDRSVLYWLDEIDNKLPILLVHGDADVRVAVDNSIRLAEKLQERGQLHRLIVYPKTGHSFGPNYGANANFETALWFKIYL